MTEQKNNNWNGYKPKDWESFAVGIFIGFILTLISQWYIHMHDNPYDWCSDLPMSESSYCMDLYDKSIDYQKSMYEKYGDPNEGVDDDYGFR